MNTKQTILLIVIILAALLVMSKICPAQSVQYEAANWKTRLLNHSEQVIIAGPPRAAESWTDCSM